MRAVGVSVTLLLVGCVERFNVLTNAACGRVRAPMYIVLRALYNRFCAPATRPPTTQSRIHTHTRSSRNHRHHNARNTHKRKVLARGAMVHRRTNTLTRNEHTSIRLRARARALEPHSHATRICKFPTRPHTHTHAHISLTHRRTHSLPCLGIVHGEHRSCRRRRTPTQSPAKCFPTTSL